MSEAPSLPRERFVSVRFNPWDHKAYAYRLPEGIEARPGDEAEVPTGRGPARVTIEAIDVERPPIPDHLIKSIARVIPPGEDNAE